MSSSIIKRFIVKPIKLLSQIILVGNFILGIISLSLNIVIEDQVNHLEDEGAVIFRGNMVTQLINATNGLGALITTLMMITNTTLPTTTAQTVPATCSSVQCTEIDHDLKEILDVVNTNHSYLVGLVAVLAAFFGVAILAGLTYICTSWIKRIAKPTMPQTVEVHDNNVTLANRSRGTAGTELPVIVMDRRS